MTLEQAWEENHVQIHKLRFHNLPLADAGVPKHRLSPKSTASMATHGDSLSPDELETLDQYKSGRLILNQALRGGTTASASQAGHIQNMRRILSHAQPDETFSYRGNRMEESPLFAKGTEITDLGCTGTSLDPEKGRYFSRKKALFAIHAPPGAKSYYLDRHKNQNQHEKELNFYPDTHFRVIGHSKDSGKHSVTHLAVVGQGRRANGSPDYSLTESPAGKLWMKHKAEAAEAGDWWRKMSPEARKAYLKEHPMSEKSSTQDSPCYLTEDEIRAAAQRALSSYLGSTREYAAAWNDMSPEAQRAYLKLHPGSKHKVGTGKTGGIRAHLEKTGWVRGDKAWKHPISKRQIVHAESATHKHHVVVTHADGRVTRHKTNSDGALKKLISNMSVKRDTSGISKTLKEKPGSLHEHLGVPHGQTIPLGKLQKLADSDHPLAKRARLVLNLKRARKRGPIEYAPVTAAIGHISN